MNELTLDTENIYLLPLARGNNHNYDGKSVVEIRKLDISKESRHLIM